MDLVTSLPSLMITPIMDTSFQYVNDLKHLIVENQHNLKIKVVRSDHGGEYYGRAGPYGKILGPFAHFL
jgi:hypothetical protein